MAEQFGPLVVMGKKLLYELEGKEFSDMNLLRRTVKLKVYFERGMDSHAVIAESQELLKRHHFNIDRFEIAQRQELLSITMYFEWDGWA